MEAGNFFCLAIDPVAPTTVYAGALSSIVKSVDGGSTWTPMGAGLQGGEPVLALAIHPTTPNVVYAANEHGGVRKSIDGGNNWTAVGPFLVPQPFVAQAIQIDPADPDTVYAGGFTQNGGFSVYETTDAGANWASTPIEVLVEALALAPGTLLAGTLAIDLADSDVVYAGTLDQGVFTSFDAGASWAPTNVGLYNTNVRALAVETDRVYAGSAGNGTFVMPLGVTTTTTSTTTTTLPQAILGRRLVIKDPKPDDPSKRKVVVVATELGSDDTLDASAPTPVPWPSRA